jgi:enoyl-CoA hydratase/carnithine racemase
MADRVVYTVNAGVADVRLNRPEKLNALDLAMFAALVEVGEALKADPTVRAVVLSGNGRGFCSGIDIGSFAAMADAEGERPPEIKADSRPVISLTNRPEGRITNNAQQAVYVWTEMPAPVIAAVHGPALGGGCQLALGADIRIVTPDAKFSILEIRWGLTPDMTGTQMLPRLVGLDVAKELTFTGRTVSGEEAVCMGMATRVSDTPRDAALTLAHEIAANSPDAVRGAKRLLNIAGQVSLADGFAAEYRTVTGLFGAPNQVESMKAYFEQRDPVYSD